MKRVLVGVAIVLSCAACGGGGSSSSQPTKTIAPHPSSGLLAPAGRAQDMVNQLNQQQNGLDQRTGTGNP